MSRRVCDHAVQLKILRDAKPALRKQILNKCNKEFVKCLCECAHNVLKGNVPLTPAQKQKLSRHKKNLRQLALKKTAVTKKKKILQSGGFLGALLTPILSLLGGLLNGGR
jgi:hypothetical protein